MSDKISINIVQDLDSGELNVTSNGKRLSFPIALQMVLSALKALKGNIIQNITDLPVEELINRSFPNGQVPTDLKNLSEKDLKENIALRAEGEMYDLLNLSIGNFLDTEFPRVNANLSLTEQAAQAAGLDHNASVEDLVQAENDLINNNPELAAQTQELQPKQIKPISIDKTGKLTAHPENPTGGQNRATRRLKNKK